MGEVQGSMGARGRAFKPDMERQEGLSGNLMTKTMVSKAEPQRREGINWERSYEKSILDWEKRLWKGTICTRKCSV